MIRWINTTESAVLATLVGFSQGLSERREVYGVSEADAAEAARVVAAAEEAMDVAMNPATRTKLMTAAKDAALKAAKAYCMRLAKFIEVNPNISDADRLAIHVAPPAEARRVPPPTTTPILMLAGIIPGGHQIELYDSARPGHRGKPKDVHGLELWVAYSPNNGPNGAVPGMDEIIKNAKFHDVLGRWRGEVIHDDERVGSVANYVGRWINRRCETGPWSQPVRMVLALPSGGANARREAA